MNDRSALDSSSDALTVTPRNILTTLRAANILRGVRVLLGAGLSSLLVAGVVAAPASASAAPRLAGAWTLDRDTDGRIDALLVEYTQPVRVWSARGRAVVVKGWRVRSAREVGGARSKLVLVSVREGAVADGAKRPRVSVPRGAGIVVAADGAAVRAGTMRAVDSVAPVPISGLVSGSSVIVRWSEAVSAGGCDQAVGRLSLGKQRTGGWTAPRLGRAPAR